MLRERYDAKELNDARYQHANVLYGKVLRYFKHLSCVSMTITCLLFTYRIEVSQPRVKRAYSFLLPVYTNFNALYIPSSGNVLQEL